MGFYFSINLKSRVERTNKDLNWSIRYESYSTAVLYIIANIINIIISLFSTGKQNHVQYCAEVLGI